MRAPEYGSEATTPPFQPPRLAQRQVPYDVEPGAVLFCGGTAMYRWITLADDLCQWDTANLGFAGATLKEWNSDVDRLLPPLAPRAVVFSATGDDAGSGTTAEEIVHYLQGIVGRVRSTVGAIPIIWLINRDPLMREAQRLGQYLTERWRNVMVLECTEDEWAPTVQVALATAGVAP